MSVTSTAFGKTVAHARRRVHPIGRGGPGPGDGTMTEALLLRVLDVLVARSPPVASAIAAAVRLASGAILIGFGQSKSAHHAKEARAFDRYGLPAPEVFTYAIGTVELVGGIVLVLGLLTRLV